MNLSLEEEKALDESIEHWNEDMVGPFKKGLRAKNVEHRMVWQKKLWGFIPIYINVGPVLCCADDCALCENCEDFCSLCIYTKFYGRTCDDDGGHWNKFIDDSCLKTALDMVKALEAIKREKGVGE